MSTPAHLTITQASILAKVSRSTLYNRIKDGRLSSTPEGIDIAELCRIYPEIDTKDIDRHFGHEGVNLDQVEHSDVQKMSNMVEWLQKLVEERDKVIEASAKIIEQKDGQLTDARARIDELTDTNVRLLESPRPAGQGRRGLLSRLLM